MTFKQLQYPIIWGETTAHFTCRLCMKTFYNKNALQNHKKTQHDDEVINSDVEFQQKTAQFSDHVSCYLLLLDFLLFTYLKSLSIYLSTA